MPSPLVTPAEWKAVCRSIGRFHFTTADVLAALQAHGGKTYRKWSAKMDRKVTKRGGGFLPREKAIFDALCAKKSPFCNLKDAVVDYIIPYVGVDLLCSLGMQLRLSGVVYIHHVAHNNTTVWALYATVKGKRAADARRERAKRAKPS